jgi:hypothetical protein
MHRRHTALAALATLAALVIAGSLPGASIRAGSPAKGTGATGTLASTPASTPANADAWPNTPAGQMGRGWVNAYCAGEDSMRAFIGRSMAPKSLEDRNVTVRVQKYKELHDQYGRLQLDSVVESTPDKVTVKLLDGDAKTRTFTFAVQEEAPHKLLSVSIRQPMDGIHGMFQGFHH